MATFIKAAPGRFINADCIEQVLPGQSGLSIHFRRTEKSGRITIAHCTIPENRAADVLDQLNKLCNLK